MAQLAPGSEEERRARRYSVRFWTHEESNTLMGVVPPDLQPLTERLVKMLVFCVVLGSKMEKMSSKP